jgi:dTDP-4-dehydrorhamnose reductase
LRGAAHIGLERTQCDITSPDSVREALYPVSPEVVVNCAAWTAVDAAEDHETDARLVNRDGSANVAVVCREIGSVLVHISTDYVFEGNSPTPLAEEASCRPITTYGQTKFEGELAVLNTHSGGTYVVRTAWLYSEHGHNFAKTMARKALNYASVSVVNDQYGQPTSAHDLASHIIDLAVSEAPFGIYHGTNSGQATWHDFACEIYSLLGRDSQLVRPVSSSEYPTKARRPAYSVLSHDRTIRNGLREMRDWKAALASSIARIAQSVKEEPQ